MLPRLDSPASRRRGRLTAATLLWAAPERPSRVLLGVAASLWEWTASPFLADEPTDSAAVEQRYVVRGEGLYFEDDFTFRASLRASWPVDSRGNIALGFRCATTLSQVGPAGRTEPRQGEPTRRRESNPGPTPGAQPESTSAFEAVPHPHAYRSRWAAKRPAAVLGPHDPEVRADRRCAGGEASSAGLR